jgi:hypothetical protein
LWSNSGTHTRLDVEDVVGVEERFVVAMVVAARVPREKKEHFISYKFYEKLNSNLPVLRHESTLYSTLKN